MKKRGIRKKPSFSFNIGNNSKAAIFTLSFVFLYLIAEIVYKVKVERQTCTWEIILLFLIFSVHEVFKKLFAKGEIPKDFSGKPLPISNEAKDKKARNRFYKKSALLYTVIFGAVTTLAFASNSLLSNVNIGSELFFDAQIPNFLFSMLVALIFMPLVYIFAYIIEFLWHEYKISLYKELLAIKEEQAKKEQELLLAAQEEAKALVAAATPKKRRGRPPKAKTEDITEQSDATQTQAAEPPKRRGRPPKKAAEKEANT